MATLSRRGFIAPTLAAGAVRAVPMIASKPAARRILTLVYDRKLGMMRAIDRLVP
ncbi:Tat pathway signal protein [Sulfitobacter sp. JB4-11]|uniref:Tat pathway signal protein n=1 Tax=Sulfitobacter rhodophyticola TaxID=3238304 RepID=UPI0035175F53